MAKTQKYVKLSAPEKFYAEKAILSGHLETLNALKHQQAYSRYRTREIKLKLKLKQQIEYLLEKLDELEAALPKMRISQPKSHTSHAPQSEIGALLLDDDDDDEGEDSLENEINKIKQRLESMRG